MAVRAEVRLPRVSFRIAIGHVIEGVRMTLSFNKIRNDWSIFQIGTRVSKWNEMLFAFVFSGDRYVLSGTPQDFDGGCQNSSSTPMKNGDDIPLFLTIYN